MAYVLSSRLIILCWFKGVYYSTEADAVNAYIASIGTEYDGRYNKSGRGYPDISAAGTGCFIVEEGTTTELSGTSCSSPIFASVIGLLNDELLNSGKPVLGYLNPWLYANPGAFNDITTGINPGCFTESVLSRASRIGGADQ